MDFSPYEARRRTTTERFGATSAKNAYANFLSRSRGKRDLSMLQEQNRQQAPNVISSFVRRGLAGPNIRSGVYSKGLQDFARNAYRAEQDVQDQLNQQQMMGDFQQAELTAELNSALADIEAAKAREIANSAATLSSFKPFLS